MSNPKRVVVTGGTGLIGRQLCRRLQERGYAVVLFSRNAQQARERVPGAAEYVEWSVAESGPWAAAVDGAHAVVHLAGAVVAGQRWTPAFKREILESRTVSARGLVNAIAAATARPQVFVTASGIDYYGPRGDEPLDESAPAGHTFLADVTVAWEAEAFRAEALGARVAAVRTGLVLDKREGALSKLLLPFQLGVGGPFLPGTQWWSWVHLADVVGLFMLAIEDDRVRGPINAVAPEPVRNRDFASTLGKVLGRPALIPVPILPLRLAMGEMVGPLLVERQRVIPKRALELGYRFAFPSLEPALRDTLR